MRTFLWSPSALSPAADRTTAESAKPLPAATRPSGARRRLAGPGVLLALAAMALAFQPAASRGQSSTNTWLQTLPDPGNTNWSNGANWSLGTGVPAGGPGNTPEMALVFDFSNHTTSTHDGDRVVQGMTFTGASNFTIAASGGVIYAGAGGIQVDGGNHTFNAQFRPRESLSVINNGGTLQFNQNFMVHLPAAGAATITFGGSGDTVLANIIRRTSGMDVTLVKTGSGSLTVNGGIGTGTPATSNQGALAGNIDVLEGTLATPQLRIGTATTSSVVTVAAGATLNVTGNTTTIDSAVGPDFGTLNVAGTFNEAGNLIVGQDNTGIVNQTGGSIDVGQNVILAQNVGSTGTINQSGGLFTVTGNLAEPAGGGTSTVNLNDGVMNIGGDLSVDNLQVGFTDGIGVADATLTVGAGSNVRIGDGGGFLTIARMVDNPPDPDQGTADSREALGTLDLRQAATTVIDVNQIRMATSNLRGRPHGELLLGGNTTLSANLFRMADVEGGSTPGGRTAALSLGQNNDFNIDTWIVGGSKSSATVGFDPGVIGGVLNLSGNTNAGVNLTIGDAQFSTGANTTSTFSTLDHTFNATIDTLRLGNFNTTGAGSSSGVLTMGAGTVNAGQVILAHSTGSNPNATNGTINLWGGTINVSGNLAEASGGGTSTVNVNDGVINVGGDLSVDNLQVGFVSGIGEADASLTVGAGSNVRIGNGGGNLTIARMVDNPPNPNQGTADARTVTGLLDLSAAATTVINVNQIRMATANERGTQHATLRLGGDTVLSANTFRMADVEGGSTPSGRTATLTLGQNNEFNINTWVIGGSKSSATVGFDPDVTGGVLNLSGNTNAGVNLTVGDAQASTGIHTTSTLDTSGHTFNADIDTLRIGNFDTTGAGSSSGVLTMDQGTVNANQVVLGQSTGSNPAATTGTLALNGGEFIAGSITRGTGTANFNFNDGLLAFESFGSASTPFHLNNTGSGQLEFGVDTSGAIVGSTLLGTGTLFGNYTQGAGAAIAFDLSFNPGADLFVVDGDVNLDGQLIVRGNGPYAGELLAPITLIENLGGNPVSGTFAGLAEGAVVPVDFDGTLINYFISYQGGPDGNNVILNVPEPGRALLLAIALGCLLARRRRNG